MRGQSARRDRAWSGGCAPGIDPPGRPGAEGRALGGPWHRMCITRGPGNSHECPLPLFPRRSPRWMVRAGPGLWEERPASNEGRHKGDRWYLTHAPGEGGRTDIIGRTPYQHRAHGICQDRQLEQGIPIAASGLPGVCDPVEYQTLLDSSISYSSF